VEKFVELFINRRGWVVLLPGVVLVSQFFGVEVTADMLESTGDKVLAAVTSLLAAGSLYFPSWSPASIFKDK